MAAIRRFSGDCLIVMKFYIIIKAIIILNNYKGFLTSILN